MGCPLWLHLLGLSWGVVLALKPRIMGTVLTLQLDVQLDSRQRGQFEAAVCDELRSLARLAPDAPVDVLAFSPLPAKSGSEPATRLVVAFHEQMREQSQHVLGEWRQLSGQKADSSFRGMQWLQFVSTAVSPSFQNRELYLCEDDTYHLDCEPVEWDGQGISDFQSNRSLWRTPKDYGTMGAGIGVVISMVSLICLYCGLSSAYYKHEKERSKRQYEAGSKKLMRQIKYYDTPFKQNTLPVWMPHVSSRKAIFGYIVVGLLFLACGIIFEMTSRGVVEIRKRYDNVVGCEIGNVCVIDLEVTADMAPPVYLYYELTNFYQNHRQYVKSRDDKQLRKPFGEYWKLPKLDCDPLTKYDDLADRPGFNGSMEAERGKMLYPCGLVAASFFTDTFSEPCLTRKGNSLCVELDPSNWKKEGIAWESDLAKRYIPRDIHPDLETQYSPKGFLMPNVSDEDFVVWMRPAAFSTFKKLNRIVLTRENCCQFHSLPLATYCGCLL